MKPFGILLFLIASATALFAQNPAPVPTVTPAPPVTDDDDVVRISTSLIQLDVTVTDSKGRIVRDLKPEDFEVFENGRKQKITGLSFVSSAVGSPVSVAKTKADPTAIPPPTATLRPDQIRRSYALVVDDLSLSFESAHYVRRALRKFVDEQMIDGDLVAIIRTGAGIGALQQFTSDKRMLYAAIEKVVWNPNGRAGIGAFSPIRDNEQLAEEEPNADGSPDANTNFENAFLDFQNATFATGTLGALRFIVGGMTNLPGRKSVILFSDGFNLLERDESGFQQQSRIMVFLKDLIDQANRASVVFYTIDARGLQVAGIDAADSLNGDPDRQRQVISDRRSELFETQAGLAFLARETGGLAMINNNDLSSGVKQALEDQSYYLVAYEPDESTFDPKTRQFNRIEIKVRGKGLDVRHRSGFFNVADRKTVTTNATLTPAEQINNALTSPFAVNDIALRLNTLFGSAPTGPFIRAVLHIDTQDLSFTEEADGTMKTSFQILAVSFGDNGVPVDQKAEAYTAKVSKNEFEVIRRNGFLYNVTLPVKKPGAYQLRVAVRDTKDGKVGSASQFIDVPNLRKKRLTISGIVLQNMSVAQWQNFDQGVAATKENATKEPPPNALSDTSLRRFPRGTVLRYGFEVYNAKLDSLKKPSLTMQARVFRDGKLLLDGREQAVDVASQVDTERWKSAGAISLAQKMAPGDYILQVVIRDKSIANKVRVATQFVQFEVLE